MFFQIACSEPRNGAGVIEKQQGGSVASHILGALQYSESKEYKDSIQWLRENWSDQILPYYIELNRFIGERDVPKDLQGLLVANTSFTSYPSYKDLQQYVWKKDLENTPDYALYKQRFHHVMDPVFAGYFDPKGEAIIRLDEISWGGVKQDGIPPLRNPKMISAKEGDAYLDDSNIVFGMEINGDARAYPKRILAWHEMFVDEVGGEKLAGVY